MNKPFIAKQDTIQLSLAPVFFICSDGVEISMPRYFVEMHPAIDEAAKQAAIHEELLVPITSPSGALRDLLEWARHNYLGQITDVSYERLTNEPNGSYKVPVWILNDATMALVTKATESGLEPSGINSAIANFVELALTATVQDKTYAVNAWSIIGRRVELDKRNNEVMSGHLKLRLTNFAPPNPDYLGAFFAKKSDEQINAMALAAQKWEVNEYILTLGVFIRDVVCKDMLPEELRAKMRECKKAQPGDDEPEEWEASS